MFSVYVERCPKEMTNCGSISFEMHVHANNQTVAYYKFNDRGSKCTEQRIIM